MANRTRQCLDTQHPPDTSLDMLKRVLAVAELVAKSKQSQADTPKLHEVAPKKHIS